MATRRTTRSKPAVTDPLVAQLAEAGNVSVVDAKEQSVKARRGEEALPVTVEAEVPDGELRVLMARHPSGAITFHYPQPVTGGGRRGAVGRGGTRVRFVVPLAAEGEPGEGTGRRGFVSRAIKTFVLKVSGPLVAKAMPFVGLAAETLWWKARGLKEGWKKATPSDFLDANPLPAVSAGDFGSGAAQPNLLLIHGTFANAKSTFRGLASTHGSSGRSFLDQVAPAYGGRLFAFDHFSVSRTPEENVRDLLKELPAGEHVFDVVTHSRGGLVLRQLAELANSPKVKLRNVALVAAPNEGTPLATPARFNDLVTWVANILDLFPDNPFTTGAAFVADGIGWVAANVLGGLPGLQAMDKNGEIIRRLQAAPGPGLGTTYSSLVSNYEPDQRLLKRMADAGVDAFFATANDLVVPTEGGWLVDPGGTPVIPGTRIGCFGRGGNIQNAAAVSVIHTNFFGNSDTIDFLLRALRSEPHPLTPVDPGASLPFRGRRGAAAAVAAATPAASGPLPVSLPESKQLAAPLQAPISALPGLPGDEIFYLTVLPAKREDQYATLLATFRNARVVAQLEKKGGEGGKRFGRIIGTQRAIRGYIAGDSSNPDLPDSVKLVDMGKDMFQFLLPAEVCRLYDLARTEQRSGRLNVIFTSHIEWMADLPWEFVYDTNRESFLAVSDVNFTRNVITSVPAQQIAPREGPLRILVALAQPIGAGELSTDEEIDVIRRGFKDLVEANLATVDVLPDATPQMLHQAVELREFDVLHFVGHGDFDKDRDTGYLLFETADGGKHRVESDVLQKMLCRRGIRLVFLNACETGKGGHARFNSGVAPALVQGGIPAVVANQYSVLDVSATAFASHFYHALAQGSRIGDAAREARIAVTYSLSAEAIDWAVPVVYARNPAEQLCAGRLLPIAYQASKVREARRRRSAKADHRHRVGLWDVHSAIPRLNQIAAELDASQSLYDFDVVNFDAPIGTWRREKDGDTVYLRADLIAEKLAHKPEQLGVDHLVVITTFPLRVDNEDLFYWADTDKRISIFSTADKLDDSDRKQIENLDPTLLPVFDVFVRSGY